MNDYLQIGDRRFLSRFFIGSGRFRSDRDMNGAIAASGAELMTVSLRRVDFDEADRDFLSAIENKKLFILPNTSGARNADEAVRLARLAAAMGMAPWVKLEITPDPVSLLPDGEETLKAARILVKDGFTVLPYMNIDPILARKLEDSGTSAVMPLASPIGTNLGIGNVDQLAMIIENASIPVIVDAGLGRPSDACLAMELGAAAVMLNTAVASSQDPVAMAAAFRQAVEAGRAAFRAGLGPRSLRAIASSPIGGVSR